MVASSRGSLSRCSEACRAPQSHPRKACRTPSPARLPRPRKARRIPLSRIFAYPARSPPTCRTPTPLHVRVPAVSGHRFAASTRRTSPPSCSRARDFWPPNRVLARTGPDPTAHRLCRNRRPGLSPGRSALFGRRGAFGVPERGLVARNREFPRTEGGCAAREGGRRRGERGCPRGRHAGGAGTRGGGGGGSGEGARGGHAGGAAGLRGPAAGARGSREARGGAIHPSHEAVSFGHTALPSLPAKRRSCEHHACVARPKRQHSTISEAKRPSGNNPEAKLRNMVWWFWSALAPKSPMRNATENRTRGHDTRTSR